jgi:hypothetical protein
MALYIPTSTRRKRATLAVGVALVLGIGMGILFGRLTAPSIDKRVAVVRADARRASASLRVLALHDQAGAVSNQAGDGGAGLVLDQTGGKLGDLFARPGWPQTSGRHYEPSSPRSTRCRTAPASRSVLRPKRLPTTSMQPSAPAEAAHSARGLGDMRGLLLSQSRRPGPRHRVAV